MYAQMLPVFHRTLPSLAGGGWGNAVRRENDVLWRCQTLVVKEEQEANQKTRENETEAACIIWANCTIEYKGKSWTRQIPRSERMTDVTLALHLLSIERKRLSCHTAHFRRIVNWAWDETSWHGGQIHGPRRLYYHQLHNEGWLRAYEWSRKLSGGR